MLKKYAYWINSGKYAAIQKFATLGLNVLSFMMLARVLGADGFGNWGLFMVISSIVETARTALIRNAYIRFSNHAKNETELGSLQAASFMISGAVSVGLSVIFLLADYPITHWLNARELSVMLQWYAITILVSAAFAQYEMILNARLDFRGICWMYCIRQALLFVIIAISFLAKYPMSATELSLMYLVTMIAGSVTGYLFAKPYLFWNTKETKSLYPKIWKFGRNVFGTNISALVFRSTDNFFAFSFFGPVVSAYYNVCLRISNLIDLPSMVFADLLFPKAAKFSADDKGAIRHMYERTVGAILVFSIPALLVILILPETIIRILAGEEYLVAAPILRITAIFGFILPFVKQFGTIMDATGHPHVNFRVMFLSFVVNIVTNLLGIYFLGVMGAAIGTATTYILLFFTVQYILNKMYGIRWQGVFLSTFHLYEEMYRTVKQAARRKITSRA